MGSMLSTLYGLIGRRYCVPMRVTLSIMGFYEISWNKYIMILTYCKKFWTSLKILWGFFSYGWPYCDLCALPSATVLKVPFSHSFHWHMQKAMIPCRCQERLPVLSYMPFPPTLFHQLVFHPLPHIILPSISWSTSQPHCFQIHILYFFWEFYFLPFSVHA
jgi:hypothetical protein